jgi:murein DD-endopeptidase MepM/ murein hydrolase activator NlpD
MLQPANCRLGSNGEEMTGRFGEKPKKKRAKRILVLLMVLVAIWLGLAALRVGGSPTVEVGSDLPGIGPATMVSAMASEPGRGLSRITVELVQGENVEPLYDQEFETLAAWQLWGPRTETETVVSEVGRETHPDLVEGEAIIRVTARPAPAWLRKGKPVVEELRLPVRLTPPLLQVASSQHYVAQGGSEVVVYRVGESAARHGVEVGEWFFPGQPLPGGSSEEHFALFAAPYGSADPTAIRLVAADDVGNEFGRQFVDQFFPRPMRADTIRLSESFMEKVVPEILSQSSEVRDQGDLLQNYLEINGKLRASNGATLAELANASENAFLWDEVFLPMPNAQVMSAFADHRTYTFNGEPVDEQDHLGFDLASTRQAPVPAANSGRVVLARYFGIYGNTVVIDHGYGLLSLNAHLSEIRVQEGEMVERGQVVGTTGETGLAGGDHLHFTMLLRGLAVNPREWWDGHWIQDRLVRKLGEALPLASGG